MITHKAPKDELLCLSGRHVCHREVFMCSLWCSATWAASVSATSEVCAQYIHYQTNLETRWAAQVRVLWRWQGRDPLFAFVKIRWFTCESWRISMEDLYYTLIRHIIGQLRMLCNETSSYGIYGM
jgi:hypothetical protein